MKNKNIIKRMHIAVRNFITGFYIYIKKVLNSSVRIQLVVVFAICLVLAGATYAGINKITISVLKLQKAYVDYSKGMEVIDDESLFILNRFLNNKFDLNNLEDRQEIEDFIKLRAKNKNINIIITDMDGKVILSASNTTPSQISIYEIMKNAMEVRVYQREERDSYLNGRKEYYICYPIVFTDFKGYFVLSGIPEGKVAFVRRTIFIIPFAASIIVFLCLFIIFTNRKMKYLEEISKGLFKIAKGNLDYEVNVKGQDELASLASNINYMSSELKANIEKERIAERTKNELITNVSHDLRTPLTSIMGYIGLIRDRRYENELQMQDYLNIVFNKSARLKSLIEDLFEYTKLNSGGIKLDRTEVDVNGFIEQIIEELVPVCEKENMVFIKDLPKQRIKAFMDADKLARVFDNLIMNAIRYSYKPGEITIILSQSDGNFIVGVKNKGDNIPAEDLENLFERFYRGDKARTSSGGGAGLGLSIAKSIVELHQGKIWAQCESNNISFYVSIPQTISSPSAGIFT